MAHHRNLALLLLAFVSSFVFASALCDAQSSPTYSNYPVSGALSPSSTIAPNSNSVASRFINTGAFPQSSSQPSPKRFDEWSSTSNSVPNDPSSYNLSHIESARRSAIQYRAKPYPNSTVISDLATTNAALADQWAELAEKINATLVRVNKTNAKLAAVTRDYEDVALNLRQHGLTPSIGLLLSHKKTQLEDWQVDGWAGHSVNDELQRSRDKQLENELIVYDGSDIARQTSEILALSGYEATHVDYAPLVSQVQSLLRARSEWLKMLTQGYDDYRQKLGELDSTSTAFEKLIGDYRELISRHVTWIRSSDPLSVADVRKFRSGLTSLFDARRSEEFGYSLSQKWRTNPASGLTLLSSILIIFLLRVLAKFWLLGIGKRKRMRETSANTRKYVASILTPLVAIAFPSILYLTARWLSSGYITESILHVSSGLCAASLVALIVEVPRQLLRTNGFVERHLKVDLPRRQRASVYLFVIGTGLVLAAYVITLAEIIDHGTWSASVARLGFIASLLLVAWTAHRSLKPNGGFLEPLIEQFAGSVLYRVRILFYLVGVGFPLTMIALSILGYQFTATAIITRAGLMHAGILIGATLWSAVKILSSKAWHSLTSTRDERQDDEHEETSSPRVSGALAEHSLELKHQIAFLSQCGLVLASILCVGWLWIDIFPNVRMGNPVVWNVQDTVTQSFIDASGQQVSRSSIASTPVTVLHLALAGTTLFVAFQLAKLLPGIFDALVLQRVNFDEAMEHLSLVLGRSLLFGTGCFIACRLVGLRWETIQWLAVGLTIGLGFAMQDIVRNVLGGLVVLFEKPARLGDLITVGNITGRVAAQKLRTTVLSDNEGREVIIPNKNFVSQDVVNWMGAGRLKAILIEVTVTRDERPADVCRMLQQLLIEQPELLLNPAPQATLLCVGQKHQRIEVLAWVEEDQDASRYRETLTKTVLNYLADKNLLTPTQPRQQSLKESATADAVSRYPVRKKRSA